MKTVSKEQEQKFVDNCKKLYSIVYHTETTVWPLRKIFRLQDYKRNFKKLLKQTIFFYKDRAKLPKNKLKILICPDGGIGDIVLTRIFVNKLKQILPNSFITVGFKNISVLKMIFEGQNLANLITKNCYENDYDLIFKGMRLFALTIKNKKNIKKFAPQFLPQIQKAQERQKYFSIFTNTPCSTEYPLIRSVLELGLNVREANLWLNGFDDFNPDFPPYILNKKEEQKILTHFNLLNKKYITIHDGFDNNLLDIKTRNKKCWPKEHWEEFIKIFKQTYPDILVVQLGAKHSTTFKNTDISLINKTSLLDLPYILNNSVLHLDGESGLSHLRTHLNKINLVMIGPSTEKYSLYEQNINILSRSCGQCMDIKNTWQTTCMMGQNPDCMTSITPQRVFKATKLFLDGESIDKILETDLKDTPISKQYNRNIKSLQEICEKNLPYAKIGYNFGPEKVTRPIIDFISKPSKKFF